MHISSIGKEDYEPTSLVGETRLKCPEGRRAPCGRSLRFGVWSKFLEIVQCTLLAHCTVVQLLENSAVHMSSALQCWPLLENSVVLLLGKIVVVTKCGIFEMALFADHCSVASSTLCDDRSWQLSSSCQNLYRFWKCSDVTPCYCNISCQICSSVSSIIESN